MWRPVEEQNKPVVGEHGQTLNKDSPTFTIYINSINIYHTHSHSTPIPTVYPRLACASTFDICIYIQHLHHI